MKRVWGTASAVLVAVIAAAAVVGCGGDGGTSTSVAPGSTTTVSIDAADFSTTIDNKYMPLMPGATFVYEGTSGEDATRVEVAVLTETKRIMGVDCVVVSDKAYINGELVEATLDWYAQDSEGNVWYFGEDTKEYENGEVVSTAGTWEAGVKGAQPGIIMEADPKVGDSYQQEFLKGEAEDMAEVLALGLSATVPLGSYDGVLKTKEWTPLEPGVAEEKLYAPGIGLIEARQVEGGSDVERLVQMSGS